MNDDFLSSSMEAFNKSQAARAAGSPMKVFDWDKAALLISQLKPAEVMAGLDGDWGWTAGYIYRDEAPIIDCYTYLASCWATPSIELDGKRHECWVLQEGGEWDANTKWPESALRILGVKDVERKGDLD